MKRLLVSILLAALFAMPAYAESEETISMDFVNVDIAVVVKYISEMTGRNFIIDEKVSGKVTIISPRKVTRDEAYKIFESILETYGFVSIKVGEVTKIVPVAEGRQKASRVQIGSSPKKQAKTDEIITQLIPLKFISADNLINVVRPLIPPTSYVAAYTPTNTIILVDLAVNRTRILEIVEQLDVEGFESTVTVHRLVYASARDLAKKIEDILGAKNVPNKQGKQEKVIADERINALIIAGNDLYVSQVKSLIAQLDVESPPGRQEVNVVYLKNADAEELAKVINQFTENMAKLSGGKTPPTTPASKGNDKILVTPEKSTNSLLITASPEDFRAVKTVIEKLDIRRKQVFVEALIFEIRSSDTSKFGVEWRTTSKFTESGVQGFGGTNFGDINNVANNPLNAGNGLVLGVVDGVMNFNGTEFLNLGGLVTALATEEGVNILSTPNLLTTDNVEAEIFVGENVPFVKSSAQTTGATPITNIERKDVGITLKVKPQINESDYVKLDIFQEISSISTVQLDKASDIITFERRAQTTVTVKNNQNIIIGGLIRDDSQESVSKVPLLGDIPVLGWLFKSKSTEKIKNNLLIFLTPHIINSDADMALLTDEKNKMMKSLQKKEENDKKDLEPEKPSNKNSTSDGLKTDGKHDPAGIPHNTSQKKIKFGDRYLYGENKDLALENAGAEVVLFERPLPGRTHKHALAKTAESREAVQ